jgi:tRNA pseudouridine13 synthase
VLPYLTADLPGIGGVLRARDDDFMVDEVPAYLPVGAGDHVFVRIEKRGLTTPVAVQAIARALGVAERDIGVAGMKDRHAVTRQWISLPPPTTEDQARAISVPDITILEVARHGNKLRTGHVRGNRFVLRVRECVPDAAARARAILDVLAAAPGAPNWYGEQRFGRDGDNAARGRELLTGAVARAGNKRFPPAVDRPVGEDADSASSGSGSPARTRPGGKRDRKMDRLMVSALQSELFNQWLVARLADGLYRGVLAGDVLHKRGGGMFTCTEPEVDTARLLAGELVATGPMFGDAMRGATPGTDAAAREAAILAAAGLTADSFHAVRAIAEGTRRDAAIDVAETSISEESDALVISFTLPGGAYATAVMREIMKSG